MSVSPASFAMRSVSETRTAPATHPTNASTICDTAAGSGLSNARSDTATRPPGFRTRAISRHAWDLSGERLMTQLEITTSIQASATGRCSISPKRNSTLSNPDRSRYWVIFLRALDNISGVISTPMARPFVPTFRPAMKTSNPPPEPKSSTTSPCLSAARALGLPHERPILALAGRAASSSVE